MIKNVGTIDRILRIALAVVIGWLVLNGTISGTLALVLGILAVLFLVTGAVSFCPLYRLLHIRSRAPEGK